MNQFMKPLSDLIREYRTDSADGLSAEQVSENARKYGVNAFSKAEQIPLWRRIWESATEPLMLILILAGCIALGVATADFILKGEADFLESAGISVTILICIGISVFMENRSAKAFEALNKINADIKVRVIRDGLSVLIPQTELVAGDIVIVGTGDKIPADGRLLESSQLYADESSLTGESEAVSKDANCILTDPKTPVAERKNMLYSGSYITSGSGKMLVTAVGDATEFGKIAKELGNAVKTQTPLQEKLSVLGKGITIIGACIAGIVFSVQVIRFISNGEANADTILEAFITSIVLIVATVPEGLPTIVAVSLSINIIKMARQNALVKKLTACETIGCINVICSDKTGTLTQNKMTVMSIKPDPGSEFWNNVCINSTAELGKDNEFVGNPTECALLAAGLKANQDYKKLRNEAGTAHVFPFSSETKRMTTLVKNADGYTVYAKGSPEMILAMCQVPENRKAEIEEQLTGFQKDACRVIGFAHRKTGYTENRDELECDMIFDGFAAIRDPLRPEVIPAVEHCRSAGIDLKMLTGDNIVTATAIATDLGIMEPGYTAREARDLEELSDADFAEELSQIRVIARCTPSIKMRVVNTLKAHGHVVAVTGDGINDAPAIKNADVGVAMGITGTEVSKAASDIVLLDDSFATIVKAVHWGRGIYENFQRLILFQLTVNASAVTVVLISVLAGFEAPFTALQLLWVNIIMDGPPALTLGLEPIRDDLMKRPPTKRNEKIVSPVMIQTILTNAVLIAGVFLAQEIWNFLGAAATEKSTVLFVLFVLFQLFNAFNSRELGTQSLFRNIGANKLMLGIFAAAFALQFAITQYCGMFFHTVPLSGIMWLKIAGTAFSIIILSEGVRLLRRLFSVKN